MKYKILINDDERDIVSMLKDYFELNGYDVLTARIGDSDKIKGFGADDYIVKPFSTNELGARVSAHLRRERRQRESTKARFDDNLTVD